MKNFKVFNIVFLNLIFISGTITTAHSQTAYELAKRLFAQTKQIKTLTYTMKKQERVEGEMVEQKSSIKLVCEPFKIYIKQEFPNDGMEVLFISETDDKALINPNGFPWFNIRLDPYGRLMRSDQHHTLYHSGYHHVISILEYLFDKYGVNVQSMVENQGTVVWDGHDCHTIVFSNPDFKYISYTVRQGETLYTIADSLKLSEYMILQRNENVDDYDDINPGQIIEIPNNYSPKIIIYVDKIRMIPLVLKIYDEEGLYEKYEYTNVKVNPVLKPEEFTKGYDEYGF